MSVKGSTTVVVPDMPIEVQDKLFDHVRHLSSQILWRGAIIAGRSHDDVSRLFWTAALL